MSVTPITMASRPTVKESAVLPSAVSHDNRRARRRLNASTATAFMKPTPRKAVKDMSVRERFSTLQDRFDASAAKGVDVAFQFNLSGDGGGKWYCTIKGGKLTVKEGTGPNPTATLSASASDYLKIANGEMNKMWAFVRGKLKVSGDKEALKKWDTYFKEK